MREIITRFEARMSQIMHALYGSTNEPNTAQSWWAEVQQLKAWAQAEKLPAPTHTPPQVIAPPAVLVDANGQRWVYAGMTDSGPAYMPQQPAMPLHDTAPVDLPWQTVTASVVPFEGE